MIKIWEQDGIYEQSLLAEFRQAIDNRHSDSCYIHITSSHKSDPQTHCQQQLPQESSSPSQQPAAENGEKWESEASEVTDQLLPLTGTAAAALPAGDRHNVEKTLSAANIVRPKTTRFYDFGEEIVAAGEAVSFVLEPQPPSSSAKVKLTNKSSANAELRVNTNQRISETGAKEVTGKEHLFTLPASCGIFFDEPVADHAELEVIITNTGTEDVTIVDVISITALTDVHEDDKTVPASTNVTTNVHREKVVDRKDPSFHPFDNNDLVWLTFFLSCPVISMLAMAFGLSLLIVLWSPLSLIVVSEETANVWRNATLYKELQQGQEDTCFILLLSPIIFVIFYGAFIHSCRLIESPRNPELVTISDIRQNHGLVPSNVSFPALLGRYITYFIIVSAVMTLCAIHSDGGFNWSVNRLLEIGHTFARSLMIAVGEGGVSICICIAFIVIFADRMFHPLSSSRDYNYVVGLVDSAARRCGFAASSFIFLRHLLFAFRDWTTANETGLLTFLTYLKQQIILYDSLVQMGYLIALFFMYICLNRDIMLRIINFVGHVIELSLLLCYRVICR